MPVRGFAAWALAGLTSATAPAARPDAAGDQDDTPRTLTAEQIVEKNVAARGGLDAWPKIQTMVWTGHIQTGNPAAPIEAFIFELKRPNKTRFEITADHEKTFRVFDGVVGWKARTSGSGAPTLKLYSSLELRSAHDAQGLDGLLINHQAKGIRVGLDGTDRIAEPDTVDRALREAGTRRMGAARRRASRAARTRFRSAHRTFMDHMLVFPNRTGIRWRFTKIVSD